MNIHEILSPDRIVLGGNAANKDDVLKQSASLIASDKESVSDEQIYESLLKRESLGSTGLGDGVAIPHARIAGLSRPVAAVILLEQGVDFEAIDDSPVDVFFSMVVAEDDQETHLQMLACLASIFSEPGFHDIIRKCETTESVYALLTEAQTSAA